MAGLATGLLTVCYTSAGSKGCAPMPKYYREQWLYAPPDGSPPLFSKTTVQVLKRTGRIITHKISGMSFVTETADEIVERLVAEEKAAKAAGRPLPDPIDENAPEEPEKRGRGRPPGSRTKNRKLKIASSPAEPGLPLAAAAPE